MRASFGGAAGKAVAGGAGKRRLIAVSVDRLGKHAAGRQWQFNALRGGQEPAQSR